MNQKHVHVLSQLWSALQLYIVLIAKSMVAIRKLNFEGLIKLHSTAPCIMYT